MNKFIFIHLWWGIVISGMAQQVDSSFHRKEGLYLDYIQFKENNPILKSQIISPLDTSQIDYFTKLVSQKEIKLYTKNGEITQIYPRELWGYFQNGILYINYEGTFYKVPVLGAISYFIGMQDVTYYTSGGIGYYPYTIGSVPVRTKERRDFLLDYYTGEVYPFSIHQLEQLLKRDDELYKEFSQLKIGQKKKKYSYYIRLFNEKHPIND